MESLICEHCGVEIPRPVEDCPICADDRVGARPARAWTTMEAIARTHTVAIRTHEPGILTGIEVTPEFAIGQRAVLVEQADGCILFDCLSLIDDAIVAYIAERGGLKAIVPSHPHFYGAMYAWSAAFGNAPILIHEQDREWVPGIGPATHLWSGDVSPLGRGVTLIRTGGHFEGGTVMHVAAAAGGDGALLTGDVIMVTERGNVSFMRNYPGYVPLHADQIRHIEAVLAPFAYRAVYGPWTSRVIETGGSEAVARAVRRHLGRVAA